MKAFLISFLLLAILSTSCQPKNPSLEKKDDPRLSELKVPEGFKISFFATDIKNARSLALGDKGTVFVGNREGKNVYALVDADNDGVAEKNIRLHPT